MEEDFDINAFIDQHDEEDLETLTVFIPEELKVDSDDDSLDTGHYDGEELETGTKNIIAVVHLNTDRLTRDTPISFYVSDNVDVSNLTLITNWFDYYIVDKIKHCDEVNLYLDTVDLSEWHSEEDVYQLGFFRDSSDANNRKIYSALINRIL